MGTLKNRVKNSACSVQNATVLENSCDNVRATVTGTAYGNKVGYRHHICSQLYFCVNNAILTHKMGFNFSKFFVFSFEMLQKKCDSLKLKLCENVDIRKQMLE